MSKLVAALKKLLADVAKLKNKAVVAGVVALLVSLLPGVKLNGQLISEVLVGVGVVASFVESFFGI